MQRIPDTDLWLPDGDTHFLKRDRAGLPTAPTYQHARIERAIEATTQRRTCIDAGAHIGIITRLLAKHFSRVIAFEPHPQTFKCLQRNTRHLPNVEIHRAALGGVKGQMGIEMAPTTNSGDRQIISGTGVKVVTLDSLRLKDVDFIKMDIQGYELFALQGAVRTLQRCRPVCLIEEALNKLRDDYGLQPRQIGEFMVAQGAKLVTRLKRDNLYVFPSPEETSSRTDP